MAIVRLLLLCAGVVAQEYAVSPPNPQPPTEQLREQRGAEHSLSWILVFIRTLIWSWGFLEGSVLFALSGYCPPALARLLLQALPIAFTSDLTALTPAFLAGTVLTLAGLPLRAHCYRALGPRFTFQLSIRPTHALVTDGVYGIVRHPSYTGFLAVAIGYFLCALDPRGLIASLLAGLLQAPASTANGSGRATVTGVLACMWATGLYLLYLLLHGRMNREDVMLESKFGDEWRVWTKRVPYRLVPGVY